MYKNALGFFTSVNVQPSEDNLWELGIVHKDDQAIPENKSPRIFEGRSMTGDDDAAGATYGDDYAAQYYKLPKFVGISVSYTIIAEELKSPPTEIGINPAAPVFKLGPPIKALVPASYLMISPSATLDKSRFDEAEII
jgi:hypothetical protein